MGEKTLIDWNLNFLKMSYIALCIFAIGTFTSISFSAVGHILMILPGIYFFTQWVKKRDFEVKNSVWALLALSFVCVSSVIVNVDIIETPLKNIFKVKYFIISFLSYFSFYYLKRDYLDEKKVKVLIHLFLLSCSIATIAGIIALFTGFNPIKMRPGCHSNRACGLYGMYMTYGYGMGFYVTLVTGALVYYKDLKKWVSRNTLFLAWFIGILGLYLSYARGAWLGFVLSLPFLFFKEKKSLFAKVTIGTALLFGTIFITSDKVQDTFLKRSGSDQGRLSFFKASWNAALERPLFGWGYRNFEPHSREIKKKYKLSYQHFGGHAHNNLLEHLASTGFIGFSIFLLFIFLWIKETYEYHPLLFTFVLSFFISGMTQYTFGDGENLFLLMNFFSLF